LNKVGHGLHLRKGPFSEYAFSVAIRELMSELGWNDPLLPQSMYIFKQAVVGGAVNSHQDSTFLFTEPRQSCCGLWLALDEATTQNGCLWLRPKSHREAVRRQYSRNRACENDPSASQFVMKELYEHSIRWDGDLPGAGSFEDLMQAGFIAVPCQPGDVLVFNGELDHLSLPNKSTAARHTFQLHLIEGKDITWSSSNWLQYENPSRPFPRLNDGLDQLQDYVVES
jgi:phytanoyl-CoA hydroxylase